MLSPFTYRNCLLRIVAVGQSDSSEPSHPPNCPRRQCPCINISKCRFSRHGSFFCCVWYLKSIILFDRNKISIQIENLSVAPWVRENVKVNPEFISLFGKFRSNDTEKLPRIGIPVPSRTKHAARHRCWMKVGVCVICHMELRFRLHHTSSRKLYSTLMKYLIDDYNAMIARRPCYGSWIPSWILRVWTVNESWRFRSISFPSRSPSQMWSREYRVEI